MIISQTTRMNVVSLFPPFVEDHFPEFGSTMVGILLCAYQIGFVMSSPFVGSYLGKIGRKKAVTIGLVIMCGSSASYGIASYIDNAGTFYAISYLSRFSQGVADSLICVGLFAITSIEFTVDPEKYQGIMQGALGFGMLMGPTLASALYPAFNYAGTFFAFAGIIGVCGVIAVSLLPKRLNSIDGLTDMAAKLYDATEHLDPQTKRQEEMEREAIESAQQHDTEIGYGYFFKNRYVMI
jgi:MFS family permease